MTRIREEEVIYKYVVLAVLHIVVSHTLRKRAEYDLTFYSSRA